MMSNQNKDSVYRKVPKPKPAFPLLILGKGYFVLDKSQVEKILFGLILESSGRIGS